MPDRRGHGAHVLGDADGSALEGPRSVLLDVHVRAFAIGRGRPPSIGVESSRRRA
ncbi:hypothetical protein QOM21_00130 [Streptomyces sp. Pv4-95]|uniref:hypothetical protein n=1 Tax=Streptomyces sp. Pv4-95 TaxID=3049543 RepID=UPI003892BE6F